MKNRPVTIIKLRPRSDFEKDAETGSEFWLGPITRTHTLGRYNLIEYMSRPASNSPPDFQPVTMFTGYVDGRGTRNSHTSLEAAIAKCMAVAHNGLNDQAGEMFMRMLR